MADPVSKASMDENYEKQMRQRKLDAKAAATAGVVAGQVRWERPVGWNGDPFDYTSMHVVCARNQANQFLLDAIKDSVNPGTTGDVIACSTMINRLSIYERAMKVRHTLRRCRATAQMLGRKTVHGGDRGTYAQLALEYVRSLLKQAKKPL